METAINVKTNEVDEEWEENSQKDMFFTFQLADEEYGVSISSVNEVIGFQKITAVPEMPDYIKGVINLRGKIIPVMDVRSRFKMTPNTQNERTCIVVVDVSDSPVGLIVDAVSDVVDIPEGDISPPPKMQGGYSSRFIKGMGRIGEKIKILINIDKLLYDDDLELISSKLSEVNG